MGLLTTTYEEDTSLIRSSDQLKQAANVILQYFNKKVDNA